MTMNMKSVIAYEFFLAILSCSNIILGQTADPKIEGISDEIAQHIHTADFLLKSTKSKLEMGDIHTDLEYLSQVLPRSYAGYDFREKNEWRRTYTALRQRGKSGPTSEWYKELSLAFSGIPDRHLSLSLEGIELPLEDYPKPGIVHSDAYTVDLFVENDGRLIGEDKLKLSHCQGEHDDLLKSTLVQPNLHYGRRPILLAETLPIKPLTCWFTSDFGPPQARHWTWYKLNRRTEERRRRPIYRLEEHEKGYFYLRISSFYARNRDLWETFVATASTLHSAQVVVIDLRGNSGGHSQPFFQWLQSLLGRQPRYPKFRRMQSAWTDILTVNHFTRQLAEKVGDEDWQAYSRSQRDNILRRLKKVSGEDIDKVRWSSPENSPYDLQNNDDITKFKGQLAVLVDKNCASACELALKALLDLKQAIIFGENTAGMASIGENGETLLPGSRIRLRFGQWLEHELTGGIFHYREGLGFPVDYWVDFSQFTVDDVFTWLKQ